MNYCCSQHHHYHPDAREASGLFSAQFLSSVKCLQSSCGLPGTSRNRTKIAVSAAHLSLCSFTILVPTSSYCSLCHWKNSYDSPQPPERTHLPGPASRMLWKSQSQTWNSLSGCTLPGVRVGAGERAAKAQAEPCVLPRHCGVEVTQSQKYSHPRSGHQGVKRSPNFT